MYVFMLVKLLIFSKRWNLQHKVIYYLNRSTIQNWCMEIIERFHIFRYGICHKEGYRECNDVRNKNCTKWQKDIFLLEKLKIKGLI